MKTLLMVIILTCCKAMATNAQLYYGANGGIGVGKSWDGKAKKVRNGINDLFLAVPVGFTTHNLLVEISPQGTASLQGSLSALGGYKLNCSDNEWVHFLVGGIDEISYEPKPLSFMHDFHLKTTIRMIDGIFMMQGTFIKRKENSNFEIGIGVIGF